MLVPTYNEARTIGRVLDQIEARPEVSELVIVDDGSTDATPEILRQRSFTVSARVIRHDRNRGKGAALRTAIAAASGDVALVLDADLEYDPADYPILLRPIQMGRSKVVYGSRFLGEHKAMYFWHAVGNQALTLVTNILFDTTLTDMETCYKVFTRDIAVRLRLKSNRWGFDPEITAKIMRMGHRIYEVPISYTGREHWEGKKIVAWRDGPRVLLTLLRYRFFK